eukprot:1842386-Pyramimonas_sp.AAC.1
MIAIGGTAAILASRGPMGTGIDCRRRTGSWLRRSTAASRLAGLRTRWCSMRLQRAFAATT